MDLTNYVEHTALIKIQALLEAYLNKNITLSATDTNFLNHVYKTEDYFNIMLAVVKYALEVPTINN